MLEVEDSDIVIKWIVTWSINRGQLHQAYYNMIKLNGLRGEEEARLITEVSIIAAAK